MKKYNYIASARRTFKIESDAIKSLSKQLDTYAETLAQWENQAIETIFPEEALSNNIKNIEVKQILNTGSSKYPISYKLRKNDQNWMIVNIIVNGVNLGLTFRNQFQALASNNNGDINLTLDGWVSDAGDAGISG